MAPPLPWRSLPVLALGHSTLTAEELLARLQAFGVRTLCDIRTVPRSRTNPQFNRDVLPGTLKAAGIRYVHVPELGGLRHPRPDSPNSAWRNLSFRGYADHMLTREFAAGLQKVRGLAAKGPVALMCAEALRWRCHRSLVADALTARGATVHHVLDARRSEPHTLTSFARLEGKRVLYPPES